MRAPGRATAMLAALALLLLAGCGSGRAASGPGGGITGTVTVLGAASLTGAFQQIGVDFQHAHPGTKVKFSFAGSSQLAQQITAGAPADVFASASPATMKTVTDAGDNASAPRIFVRNQLVIAVPHGNPQHVTGLADLTRPGVKVALCAVQVPCGAAAHTALRRGWAHAHPSDPGAGRQGGTGQGEAR